MAAFRFLSQWFLSFLIVWTPFAVNAQSAARQAATPLSFDQKAEKLFGNSSNDVLVRHLQNTTQIIRKDNNGKELVIEMPHTKTEELRKFAPRALMKEFKEAMVAGGTKQLDIIKHTMKTYPAESIRFFLAIGAVTAFQLFTDYSSNPMRMEQHIEHSLSPIGMFSFFMFMYANGATTQLLQGWMKNPKFHVLIPYLGMTAGFFVQSTIATFAADPNVKLCVARFFNEKAKVEGANTVEPCDAAFNFYVLKKKANELMPGLISMIGSTMIAGVVQKGVTSGILRLTGVNIALWFIPGGVGLQAVRFAIVSMVQMGVFYYIDVAFLNRFVTFAWRNFMDGRELAAIEKEIVDHMNFKKRTGWSEFATGSSCLTLNKEHDCIMNFPSSLKKFNDRASNWRMLNLMDVYEAHQTWQQNLSELNAQYNTTYNFYDAFVSEVRNREFKLTRDVKLDLPYPLLGVTPKDQPEDRKELQYTKPFFTEGDSSRTAAEVGAWWEARLKNEDEMSRLGLFSHHVEFLTGIAKRLQSSDAKVQGQAILDMYEQRRRSLSVAGHSLAKEVDMIRIKLGGYPLPTFEPGHGFLLSYERYSADAQTLEKTHFPEVTGIFRTPMKTDHLLIQMACGPDAEKNEKVVASHSGYAASFIPPRLTNDDKRPDFCTVGPTLDIENLMYKYPVKAKDRKAPLYKSPVAEGEKEYPSVLDFVKNNTRESVLGSSEKSGFPDWWENNTQARIKAAYDRFSEEYDKIIVRLIKGLNQKEDSTWNTGPLANGVIDSIRQGARLNLMILGELMKDSYRLVNKAPLPAKYFSSKREPKPPRLATKQNPFPLLAMLRAGAENTSVLEWEAMKGVCMPGDTAPELMGSTTGYPLHIQKEIEYEMEVLIWQLRQIQIVQVEGRERIQSKLENSDFETQVEKMTKKLTEFSDMLGVGERSNGGLTQLTPEQRDLALTALENLQQTGNELALYGAMANAVSWDKIRNLKSLSLKQQEFNNAAASKAAALSNMMNKRVGSN